MLDQIRWEKGKTENLNSNRLLVQELQKTETTTLLLTVTARVLT